MVSLLWAGEQHGRYQILKKWLSYREKRLLGHDLRPDEALEFAVMVVRISD